MLYKQAHSSCWWTQFKHNGRRYRLSTGTPDRKAAEVEARRLRVEVEQLAGPRISARPAVTLGILEELDVERSKNKSHGERREATIRNLWRNIHRHLGEGLDVMTLQAAHVEAYEGVRRAETHRGAPTRGQTIRREVEALRRGLKRAKRDRIISRLPFDWDDLDPIDSDPPDHRQEGKVWPLPVVAAVLNALSRKAKTAGYERMLKLMLCTGMRLEEFRRCTPTWMSAAPRGSGAYALLTIPAESSKTKAEPRAVPISKEAAATIRDLWPRFAKRKFNHALELASAAAQVGGVMTPRDLRATYLTHAAKLSGDVVAAQRLGGHSNIATTGLYLDADLSRAVAAGVKVLHAVSGAIRRGHTANGKEKKASKNGTRP
jgi:integrase